MRSLYKNQEMKNITYKYILLQGILLISIYLVFTLNVKTLNREYISHNKVLATRLIALNPSMKSEIIRAFTKEISDNEIRSSETALNEYGYRDTLDVYKNTVISRFSVETLEKLIIFIVGISMAIYFGIMKEFQKIFLKIREFSKAAEAIAEGGFHESISDNKEGDFYVLASEFNVMATRLTESLNRLKEDKIYLKTIISDISHQLKTPLSALMLYNGLMENDETMKLEERMDLLKSSSEQLDRMDWLCKNLLKLARLEACSVEFKKKDCFLFETLKKSLSPLLIKAQEKQQEISLKVNENIKFKHDTEWMTEAFTNIIKNAIEHTNSGGNIKINAAETPLSVQIIIKDNGEGIPKKELSKIFNRFYKGENSTNPTSIGIGLALSKTIIEGQQGSISVKSEEGKGTEFSIIFLKTVI